MIDEKMVSFSISNDENTMNPEDIENSQFTKVHFRIYSADKVNDHNYTCSLKVLKKYAKTIAGKPILVWYNKYANGGKGDFAGHEDSVYAKEYPVGFFPNDVEITYEKDEDGTVFLCADGYIWTLYYSEIVEVFKNYGGIKGVSSEMLIIESEVIEGTNIEDILQYSFAALTLIGEHDALGTPIKPAVDGCNGILVTNATTNAQYEKAKLEFEKILYNSTNQESDTTDSFFDTKNKEENMSTENIKDSSSLEVIENATQEVTTRVGVSTSTYSYDDNGRYVGSSREEHSVVTTEIKEVPEDEVNPTDAVVTNASEQDSVVETTQDAEDSKRVENATIVEADELETLKTKCSALEEELSTKNTEYNALLQKCSVLEEYKRNKENESMEKSIELALNSVSHILNSEQIDEWRKDSENCSFDTVDGFINKLKAFAFDIQEKNGVIQTDSVRNCLPKVDVEPTDFWERMDRKYS